VRGAIRPTAGAVWRPGVEISAPEGSSPEVAVGPDGRALVIWRQRGSFTTAAPPSGIYVSRYEASLLAAGLPQSDTCVAPVLSHVHVTHTRFRVAQAPTAIEAKTASGTAFLFELSFTADVSVAFSRLTTGLRRGHFCVAPTGALRRTHATRCQRTVAIATLTRRSQAAGEDRIPLTGRIGQRALTPGSYTARLTAANVAGSSAPAVVHLEITR
jgi:hypothetical protein